MMMWTKRFFSRLSSSIEEERKRSKTMVKRPENTTLSNFSFIFFAFLMKQQARRLT